MGNSVMLNGIEYAGEQIAYKDSTYELVSKVAYLIGVPLRIFQNEHEPPKIEIYNRLEQDKNARIIRNLCIIRTAIERNYRKINDIMRMEYRGLLSMPEILPMSSMQQLSNDGISFIKKSSTKLCHHIIEINRLISDRINNCKSLFPIWINRIEVDGRAPWWNLQIPRTEWQSNSALVGMNNPDPSNTVDNVIE